MQLEAVLVICTSLVRYWVIYTPRFLANETGDIVLPNRDKEIWGSLLISCAHRSSGVWSGNNQWTRSYTKSKCKILRSILYIKSFWLPRSLFIESSGNHWSENAVFQVSMKLNSIEIQIMKNLRKRKRTGWVLSEYPLYYSLD